MARKSCLAFLALILSTLTSAHMNMQFPPPFSPTGTLPLDSGPLSGNGDFPCKANIGFGPPAGGKTTMAAGSPQQLTFKGSAVHGGGSCQLSITTDNPPTASSKFKVIKSLEGGCPGVDGPVPVDFTIPKEVPNGDVVFAWTWIAKLSGGPEFYMNCAPITVTGGASDTAAFDALPDMFVANIQGAPGGCKTQLSADARFPNPGENLVTSPNAKLEDPSGDCGAAAAAPGDDNGGGSPSPPANGGGAPVSSAPAASAPASFFPAPSPSAPISVVPVEPPASPTSTITTLVTVTGAPAAPSAAPPAAPPSSAPGGGGENGTTACAQDGALVCNGPTQFGLCNHGSVAWQAVAAGTQCQGGAIVKREIVVPGHAAHVRRHVRGLGRKNYL